MPQTDPRLLFQKPQTIRHQPFDKLICRQPFDKLTRAHLPQVRDLLIVDMRGVSMSTVFNIGIVKAVAGMGSANFPELMQKTFIVNAPW